MEMKRKVHPTISFQGKRNMINIGVDVIRLLGEPTHICILRNFENKSVAVVPCEADDVMSFRVPERFLTDRNSKFTVHSKQFTQEVMEDCGLDTDRTYVFPGEYIPKNNMVVFFMQTAGENE